VKRIMLWTVTSNLLDINLEIERPDGHSILFITLTNKLFYQVSELIYEKQAFNIFINGSDRLRGDCCLIGYMNIHKKVFSTPWHPFRKVRIRDWRHSRTKIRSEVTSRSPTPCRLNDRTSRAG
jgi:hypothetical protein